MKRFGYVCVTLGLILSMTACKKEKDPQAETTTEATVITTSTEAKTEPEETTIEATTTQEATEPLEVVITTEEEETNGADAKLDTINESYVNNNISISYPKIVGLHADEMEQKANTMIKEHILSVIEQYDINEETDQLEITNSVLTLYRGQISILYLGSYTKAGSMEAVNLCMTENINLITGNPIRLSSRYSADGLMKLLTKQEYEINSANTTNFNALKEHLANQQQKYYANLVANGDFGGEEFPAAFSYSNGSTLHIIILVPHILGDYVELTAVQKIK